MAEVFMMEWANAAKPFNYDPVITDYRDQTNKLGEVVSVVLATRTHSLEVIDDLVSTAVSNSDSDQTTDEARSKWYQCTGTWTEQEAVAETRAILERMGATQTLAAIATHTYEATPLPLMTPDGQPVKVTPFIIVEFYNANGKRLLEAEYRMGPTGPAGLVRWWHWP